MVHKTLVQHAIVMTALTLSIASGFANENHLKFGGDFALTDQDNEPFELKQIRGKIVLLFFGYTYCPNLCPKEMSKVAAAIKSLGSRQHLVQGLFVSIDPQRDTPEKLKTYINYFSSEFIGLTGTTEQIEAVAKQYDVNYKINKTSDSDRYYEIDHTTDLYIIDQAGKLIRRVHYGLSSRQVSVMLKEIL